MSHIAIALYVQTVAWIVLMIWQVRTGKRNQREVIEYWKKRDEI